MKKLALVLLFAFVPVVALAQEICVDSVTGSATKLVCTNGVITGILPGTGALNLGKAIDSVAGATDVGVPALAIRTDSPSTITPANNDWTALRTNANGKLWITGGVIEDQAHTDGETLVGNGFRRFTTYASSNGSALSAGEWSAGTADNSGAIWVNAVPQSATVANQGTPADVKYAVINVDGADSDSVIAAVVGMKIRVLGYTIVCDGASTVTFEDGDGTDITGAMPLAANGGVSASVNQLGQFQTPVANKSLNILKGSAVSCDGHITYVEVT